MYPPSSIPEITPEHVWSFLKSNIYDQRPKVFERFFYRVRDAAINTPKNLLENTVNSVEGTLRLIVDGKQRDE